MKKTIKKILLMTLSCALFAMSSVANAASPCPTEGQYYFASEGATGTCRALNPDEVWTALLAGNASYITANTSALDQLSTDSQPLPRQLLGSKGQKPEAIILTCSDSRLPPEILFNAGLGKLFVVRVAGNIVDPHELGSIEYAVEHLGTRLVVVLGHEKCGAVKATYDAYPATTTPPAVTIPYAGLTTGINSLVASIWPAVDNIIIKEIAKATLPAEQATQLDHCVAENSKLVAESLITKSAIIKEYVEGRLADSAAIPPVEAIAAGTVKIINAYYKLDTGVVTLTTTIP